MSEAKIRVALVDDDNLVRMGLELVLGGSADIEIVGQAADGRAGVDLVAETSPDVVLMDIRMPVMDGIAATTVIARDHPNTAVIVLTTFDTDDMVIGALREGAGGFLLKSTRPDKLVAAIRGVAAGEPVLSPSVTALLMNRVSEPDPNPNLAQPAAEKRLAGLTEREREVAIAMGRGDSNAEIAKALFMSVPTVKTHVSRVLTKLQVDNRTQVALLVHDAGLTM
ncbi:response regulator transcription factor [Ornithinimicrobium sp. Arc0846-15]|nr:response regulator transcription factor [Ornithinimicrobium laminariae]